MQIRCKYFCFWLGYYDAWPSLKNGTKYWCLEIAIGKPEWEFYCDLKLDFWNPINYDGWKMEKNEDGIEHWIHE